MQVIQFHCWYQSTEISILKFIIHREVKDRDEINEFLRKEIRLGDMRAKVEQELAVPASEGVATSKNNKVTVLVQREQTISELEKLLEEVHRQKDEACTQLK